MNINLLCDAYWESRIERVLDELSATGYSQLFAANDYGKGLSEITVVFVCHESSLNLKQRVIFSRKEKRLYVDVLLNLDEMKLADTVGRKRLVVERLADEVSRVLSSQRIEEFDAARFVNDFIQWIADIS